MTERDAAAAAIAVYEGRWESPFYSQAVLTILPALKEIAWRVGRTHAERVGWLYGHPAANLLCGLWITHERQHPAVLACLRRCREIVASRSPVPLTRRPADPTPPCALRRCPTSAPTCASSPPTSCPCRAAAP